MHKFFMKLGYLLWPHKQEYREIFIKEEFQGERIITWIRLIFVGIIALRAYMYLILDLGFYGRPMPMEVVVSLTIIFIIYLLFFIDLRFVYYKKPHLYKPYYRYIIALLDIGIITYLGNELLKVFKATYQDPAFTSAFSFIVIILYLFVLFYSAFRFDPMNIVFAMLLAIGGQTYLFLQYMDFFTASIALGQLLTGGMISAILARSMRLKIVKIHETALMERYLPQELVRRLSQEGMSFDVGGQVQKVAVLFADIRGFTSLTEKKTPEQTIEFLNEYLGQMSEIVFQFQGTLDKFMGDAIMAIYGAPFHTGFEVKRAVQTALAMVRQLPEFNRKIQEKGFPAIEIGVGIAYGDVVAGNIGSQKRMEYTVIGDIVNIAARLEQLNKELKTTILVTQEIQQIVAQDFIFSAPLLVNIRGKAQPLTVFSLDSASNALS